LRCPAASSGALCCQEPDGVFWYRGRNHQLWRLVGDQFELVPADSGLKGKRINALVTDANGRVWVGTEKEIAVWDGTHFQDRTPTNVAVAGEGTRRSEDKAVENPPPHAGGSAVN